VDALLGNIALAMAVWLKELRHKLQH